MTKILTLALLLSATSLSARAEEPEEDGYSLSAEEAAAVVAAPMEEDPAPVDEAHRELSRKAAALTAKKGEWGYLFMLIRPGADAEVLTSHGADRSLIPASTMKLFSGWMGFHRDTEPREYIKDMLRQSDNEMADDLLDAEGGPSELYAFLKTTAPDGPGLVSPESSLTVVDGSGYDRGNRATPAIEVALLRDILWRGGEYPEFKDCLAQPGVDSTLEKRLLQFAGRLYAKTGTLTHGREARRVPYRGPRRGRGRRHPRTVVVRDGAYRGVDALAGFLETDEGVVVFSAIGNVIPGDKTVGRGVIDQLVALHYKFVVDRRSAALATR